MELNFDIRQEAQKLAGTAEKPYANETELRQALYLHLYPYCINVVKMEESRISHEGTVRSGRFDSLFGSVLIEYKNPGELETETKRRIHERQAVRYLEDETVGASIVILTDGRMWGILRRSDITDDDALQRQDVAKTTDSRFQWKKNGIGVATRVLELLDTNVYDPVTPRSILSRLGVTTTHGLKLLTSFAASLRTRSSDSRTEIMFQQWLALAGVSYGIGDKHAEWPKSPSELFPNYYHCFEGCSYAEAVYSLQTYIGVAAKLIALETLALQKEQRQYRPSLWLSSSYQGLIKHARKMESGIDSKELNADNLIGSDLFSWYVDHLESDPSMREAYRQFIFEFGQLAWARLAYTSIKVGDLMRDLYNSVMPNQFRKILGEFFTPQWLAEHVVSTAANLVPGVPNESKTFLDPSCGSGTFLIECANYLINASQESGHSRAETAETVVKNVVGFDINPVSVLMSRVNMILALGDLIEEVSEVRLKIFQADSILIPQKSVGQASIENLDDHIRVPLAIGEVALPKTLAKVDTVTSIMSIIGDSVEIGRSPSIAEKILRKKINDLNGVDKTLNSDESLQALMRIYNELDSLHREGRNGIWANVISQSFVPRVVDPADVVVGNPPWISWKNLPPEWRNRSEDTWKVLGLWQTKGHGRGTPMSDISSLMLARCIRSYSNGGVVGLLMPKGILDNHEGGRAIRRCSLRGNDADSNTTSFNPIKIEDFSSFQPFEDAHTRTVALYVRPDEPAAFPVPGSVWKRRKRRAKLTAEMDLDEALRSILHKDVEYAPVDENDISSAWKVRASENVISVANLKAQRAYTWGQGMHTRGADGIFFCEMLTNRPFADGLVRVKTRPNAGRTTKSLESVQRNVDPRYLWPLLRGRNVHPFSVDSLDEYVVLPVGPDELGKRLSVGEVLSEAPSVYEFFEPHMEFLKKRKGYDLEISDEMPWGVQGHSARWIRRNSIYVAIRYMHSRRRPPASVLLPSFDERLGFDTVPYPNNNVNILVCDSVEEADYVAAVVNSSPAQSLIEWRSNSTTIGPKIMNDLPIERYNANLFHHRCLSGYGQECRHDPEMWEILTPEIDNVVLELWRDV